MDLDIPRHPDFSTQVDGPFLVTFTAHLPFPVGIPNELGHTIVFGDPFESPEYVVAYKMPFVNIRVFDLPRSGLPLWQEGTHAALKYFYGYDLGSDTGTRYGEADFAEHNQWVTLETPWGAIQGHDADPFHRALGVFNGFLQAVMIITRDIRIHLIASHDLRPVVVIGALPKNGQWLHLTDMYMHPEAMTESLVVSDKPFDQDQLNSALFSIVTNKPYVTTIMWRARAQRALRQTGDGPDAVISFQIAAESLLFDTYRMLLTDEGLTSGDIAAELQQDRPFKRFFTDILPRRLGGDWHPDHSGTPVANYWKNLYEVRNAIIHTGMLAHTGHAQAAQTAYWALRDHLEERLWANHKTYPRTTYARLGREGLEKRNCLTRWIDKFMKSADAEPGIWYWPYDLAGRPSPEAPDSDEVEMESPPLA
jgi:hypothetical protein